MKGRLDVLRQELRDLGWIEGKNLAIEYRFASGNPKRLPKLALELVKLDVDVIVTSGGTQPALAAKNAAWTIPIIFAGSGDPVAYRLVASLASPGGNITGMTLGGFELYGKRLELLKESVPQSTRIAVCNPTHPATRLALEELDAVL